MQIYYVFIGAALGLVYAASPKQLQNLTRFYAITFIPGEVDDNRLLCFLRKEIQRVYQCKSPMSFGGCLRPFPYSIPQRPAGIVDAGYE